MPTTPTSASEKPTVAELLADGEWDPGAYRSDSMMVVHIPADRKSAYVVSVPRDSYVPIYDGEGVKHGKNKINEAFSAVRPVRHAADHREPQPTCASTTWRSSTSRASATSPPRSAASTSTCPRRSTTPSRTVEWEQGTNHLEGVKALQYVRTRHGLANGDFDRVDRQQNFLRALMGKVLADGTIGNPLKFTDTLEAITKHLTVDAELEERRHPRPRALDARPRGSRKVRFMTLPLDRYETVPDAGSVNIIAAERARKLWTRGRDATRSARYLKANPDDELPDPQDVS